MSVALGPRSLNGHMEIEGSEAVNVDQSGKEVVSRPVSMKDDELIEHDQAVQEKK